MKITIKDIAKKANVSIATVSRALNNQDKSVNFQTKQKVFGIARMLNYPLNGKKTMNGRNIGIISRYLFPRGILKQQSLGFYNVLLSSVEKWLRHYDYNTIFSSYEEKEPGQVLLPKWVVDRSAGGVIIIGKVARSFCETLDRYGIPFVIINYSFKDVRYNTVLSDNFGGAYALVGALLRMGHKRIAFIREGTDHPSFDERFRGYLEALQENGIFMDTDLVMNEDYSLTLGYESMRKLLKLPEPPTAVFAVNDYVGMNALRAVKESGLKVPEDISIVGFDAMAGKDLRIDPPLTSARVFADEMAHKGIKRLFRIMSEDLPAVSIMFSSPVVEGKSWGPNRRTNRP